MDCSPDQHPLEFDPEALKVANRVYTVVNSCGRVNKLILSPKQIAFLSELFSPDKTVADACKKAGITPETAARWLKQRKIRDYISQVVDRIKVESGQSVKEFTDGIWAVWRGEREIDESQRWAGDRLGKIMGLFKEKIIHERYDEIVFTEKRSRIELDLAQDAEISGPVQEPIHLPDMRQTMGQEYAQDIPSSKEVPKTRLDSVASSPTKKPS